MIFSIVNSKEEMEALGSEFVKTLPKGSVVAFRGDLGAGKTTFVRGMVRGLGLEANIVSSPTFAYLNIYGVGESPLIYHFDLYRLRGEEEFHEAGFDEYLETSNITCIEWSERVFDLLPKGTYLLSLAHQETDRGSSRVVEVRRL